MRSRGIRSLRLSLGITQSELAELLGVHTLTVSKWERGLLWPGSHQLALLQAFERAGRRNPSIGASIGQVLVGAGLGIALYTLLRAAFDEPGPKTQRGRTAR